nr:hypothetical protein [uncultured Cellulosilyticum sp.]
MKKRYLIAMLVGVYLTPQLIVEAAIERGCFAIGGELLLIPLLLMIVGFFDSMRELWRDTNEKRS